MALIQRTQVIWDGFPGAPGYSTFYSTVSDLDQHDPRVAPATIREALTSILTILPDDVQLRISSEAEVIEDTTGELVAVMGVEPPLPALNGTGSATFSAPSGAAVEWRTAGLRRGRRVRGRTFLVPLGSNAYQDDGSLTPIAMVAINAFIDEMVATDGAALVVWARPVRNPDTGAIVEEGENHRIWSGTVRDRAAVLRSRRD